MEDSDIITEKLGRVCQIRLNRPSRANSFTPEMLEALKLALIDAQQDKKIRVVILTGTGDNFTTGMDLGALKDIPLEENPRVAATMERLGAETSHILMQGKISICAINGRVMGMGVVYTLASDLRYAVDDATFQLPEIDASIIPAANCMTLLVQQLGIARTKEMLFTCKQWTAQDFKSAGIVNEIFPREAFMESVMQIAKQLSRKNQDVLRFTKACLNHVPFVRSFQEGSSIEEATFLSTFQKDKDAYLQRLADEFGLDVG
ncbi:MAG TPA: enoyl-CoA hydratase/isomerase family protein [Candidatus Lokiarchaeia archaeon]|nr:enoyl-CoA hydratase/isomerase family protein [Candidatus Lokiarchaeia archaeon]